MFVRATAIFRNQSFLLALLVAAGCGCIGAAGKLWARPPPPVMLAFTVEPIDGIAGQTLATIAVSIEDAQGNVVTLDNATQVQLTLSKNTLNGTLTQTATSGVASFNDLLINTAATGYTLSAATVNVTPALIGAASTSFNISAGTPSKLAFVQEPTDTFAGLYLNPAVTVVVQDKSGNTVSTDSSTLVTVSAPICGGSIPLEASTDSAAIATFSDLRLNSAAIGDALNATAFGLTGASSTAFNVMANPDRIVFDGFDDPLCTP